MFLPSIIETDGRGLRSFDLPSKLFEQSIITLFGDVTDDSANAVIMQLIYLDSLDNEDEINLYINSPGGSVYAGLAIHDVIRNMRKKVNTVCVGSAMSMGAFLLICGTGERKSLPNSRIMIHSVSGYSSGTFHDQLIDLKETEYLQNRLLQLMVEYSNGKITKDAIDTLTQRDKFLSPQEAYDLGFIDKII